MENSICWFNDNRSGTTCLDDDHFQELIRLSHANQNIKTLIELAKEKFPDCLADNNDQIEECVVYNALKKQSHSKKEDFAKFYKVIQTPKEETKLTSSYISTIINTFLKNDDVTFLPILDSDVLTNKNHPLHHQIRSFKPQKSKIALIINTAPITKPGEHWVSGFITFDNFQSHIDYFDSYGNEPLGDIRDLLYHLAQSPCTLNWNRIRLQQNNYACGWYCIWYTMRRIEKCSHETAINTIVGDENVINLRSYFGREGQFNLHPSIKPYIYI